METINVETNQTVGVNLTEGAMALIEGVVQKTNLTDPKELLPYVCDELMDRFPSDTLEDVVRSITCFFISKRLYPTKSYLS